MKRAIILLVILILVVGCTKQEVIEEPEEEQPSEGECEIDANCATAGCSGQLCLPKEKAGDIRTTCEFRAEYECFELTSCSCNEGKCGWVENDEYSQCLNEKTNT